jgi:predicted ATPase
MKVVERFFVITGGPGSGKSSLIEALERRGYARTMEAGRRIIQDQLAIGGNALPWADRALFAEMMLCWEIRSYRIAEETSGSTFFDRGTPDVMGYLKLCGLPVPAHVAKAAEEFRYHSRVFVAPPWPEIFCQDQERKQDFNEASRTHDILIETYRSLGYALVELPKASVEERVAFVLRTVGE